VGPGLSQFNVVVPSTVTLGQDVLVVGLSGDFETQPGAFSPSPLSRLKRKAFGRPTLHQLTKALGEPCRLPSIEPVSKSGQFGNEGCNGERAA
jgi:hypothetical protein